MRTGLRLKHELVILALVALWPFIGVIAFTADYDSAIFYEKLCVRGGQSDGQRLATGYFPKGSTIIRSRFTTGSATQTQGLFCSRTTTSRSASDPNFVLFVRLSSGLARFDYYDAMYSSSKVMPLNTTLDLEVKDGKAILYYAETGEILDDSMKRSGGMIDFVQNPGHELYLFNAYVHTVKSDTYGSFNNGASLDLHSFDIYEPDGQGGETLVHAFVPCLVGDRAGLADKVDEKVIYPEGGSSITVGGKIVPRSRLLTEFVFDGKKLNTSTTAIVSDFPRSLYFCCGDTDGGTDTNAWERIVYVGEIATAETVLEDERRVDFRYAAYFAPDGKRVAWSEVHSFDMIPKGTIAQGSIRRHDAAVEISVTDAGFTNDWTDVYFAIAKSGESMPEPVLAKHGVVVGDAFVKTLTGLDELTDYQCRVVFRNDQGFASTNELSFVTHGSVYWEQSTYVVADWTNPVNRLATDFTTSSNFNGSSSMNYAGFYDHVLTTRVCNVSGSFYCHWQEPKDITSLTVYTGGGLANPISITNLMVRYGGSEEFVPLSCAPSTYPAYSGGQARCFVLHNSEHEYIVTNVLSLKITTDTWLPSHVCGISELTICGKSTDSACRWDYGWNEADDFILPSDVLWQANSEYVTETGFHDAEHDGTLTPEYSKRYKGYTWTWEFSRPHHIRTVQLWGYHGSSSMSSYMLTGVYYKLKGDAEYRQLKGSSLDRFNGSSNGHYAILRPISGKDLLRNVVALQLVLGPQNGVYVGVAEVLCTGIKADGLKIILR